MVGIMRIKAKGLNIERKKEYQKEYQIEYQNKYHNQQCLYNGETLTLCALRMRFKRQGVEHPQIEAKKYIIKN